MSPGITEEAGSIARAVIDALRMQPLALALIVVNLMFIAVGAYALQARNALILEVAKTCLALNEGQR